MSTFNIKIQSSEQHFTCKEGEAVLKAMERQNLAVVPVGCRCGGCGVCRVKVLFGKFDCGPMSKAHVTLEQKKMGFALACRLQAKSDLVIKCMPSQLATSNSANQAKTKKHNKEVKQ